MDVVELIFVRPAPVVMFAPLGVIPDGLPKIPVEVQYRFISLIDSFKLSNIFRCLLDRHDRVQRRAARFVVGDFRRKSSVTKMTQELEWESLAERRKTARLCQFYFVHNA